MSAVLVLALLWAAVGLVLLARWWSERGPDPSPRGRWEVPPGTRFGQATRVDGPRRRLQAMRLAYGAGTTVVALGFLTGWAGLLALGALLVNVGTMQRYLVEVLDLEALDRPMVPRRAPRPATA
jgi:hypothetical protein